MGDFNAKVGNERVGNTVGPFGLGDRNDRGDNLISWCQSHNLVITNTWFKNHPRRLWTWKSPGDRTRNQIDYILVPRRFRNSVISSKTIPGADCDSDHVPIINEIRIKLKKLRKTTVTPKIQSHLLKTNNRLQEDFRIKVQNRFDILSSDNNPTVLSSDDYPTVLSSDNYPTVLSNDNNPTETEILWEQIKSAIIKSTEDTIPTAPKIKKNKWMTDHILQLMEQRRTKNRILLNTNL